MIVDKPGNVYAVTVPDGRQYVGVTSVPVHKRLNNHFNTAKTSKRKETKFYEVLKNLEPKDVKIEILDSCANKQEAIEKERLHIKRLDTMANGLNTVPGGQGTKGYVFTEVDKKKISESQKKRFEDPAEREKTASATKLWIANNQEAVREITRKRNEVITTKEHSLKMSEIMKKSHQENPEFSKKQGETLLKRYAVDDNLKERISRSLGGSPIEASKDGKVEGVYPSIGTAAKKLILSGGNIASVLEGRRNHTGGYTFRRLKDV